MGRPSGLQRHLRLAIRRQPAACRHLRAKENHRRRHGYVANSLARGLAHTHSATTTANSRQNPMVDPTQTFAPLSGPPMLGRGHSDSLINPAYRFRELPYSDNFQPLTDHVVPWALAYHGAAPEDSLGAAARYVTVHPYSGGEL